MQPLAADGWSAGKIFEGAASGYCYDDIVFLPGHLSFEVSAVDIRGQLTRNIALSTPLVGIPEDTTEADVAIALALVGGIGIIHRNQDVGAQADMVRKVKRHVSGFVLEPVTLGPSATLEDYDRIRDEQGVTDVPITDWGLLGEKLLGFVTARDADLFEDRLVALSEVMVRQLVTGKEPITLEDAYKKLKEVKVGTLPIVDEAGRLVGMVARADLKKLRDFPRMSRSLGGQLLVGATVAEGEWDRARELVLAGADVLCVDAGTGSGDRQQELIRQLKAAYPALEVVAGPVASCREAKRLLDAGADGLLAGCAAPPGGSSGSGAGPDATAVYEVARYARLLYDRPVLAAPAGGARGAADALKALGLGASAVALGTLLAGTEEAAGKLRAEASRAVGGPEALRGGCAAGSRGPANALMQHLTHGVKCGMQDLGIRSLPELHAALACGDLRMECRAPASAQLRAACARALQLAARPEVRPAFATLRGRP